MRLPEAISSEIADYVSPHILQCPQDFVCVYGSSVYSEESWLSDIDLFAVTHNKQEFRIDNLVRFIKDMHDRHGRKIDEEVPFDNKVHYTGKEVDDALAFSGFDVDNGVIAVPLIIKEAEFLGGAAIKARLALNALTTPHLAIGDDLSRYRAVVKRAETSATLLAVNLIRRSTFDVPDLYDTLTEGDDGQAGEMYLGYKTEYPIVGDHLHKVLEHGLTSLATDDILIEQGSGYRLADPSVDPIAYMLKQA